MIYFGTYTQGVSEGIYVGDWNAAAGTIDRVRLAGKMKNPSFLAVHPNRRFLFAVGEVGATGESGSVVAFAIRPADGALEMVNSQPSGGAGPCHLQVDPQGKNVLVANYGGGSVAVVPIADDGSLRPAASTVQHTGSSVNRERQSGPHAHAIYVTPDGRLALAVDLGLDQVLSYQFDAAQGQLKPIESSPAALPPGSGPRHLAFHPNGRWAYVINELTNAITAFGVHPDRGLVDPFQSISTLPADAVPGNSTAEIVAHPTGRFLYGSNRGHDSIAMFAVDADSGRLRPLGHQPTGGRTPRNFAIDSAGHFLLAANQNSDAVTVHRIDAKTGLLAATSNSARVPTPVCVTFVELSD